MPHLWQEAWQGPFVELNLSDHRALEETLSSGIEGSMEEGQESHGVVTGCLLQIIPIAKAGPL
jgi:hypothetical protein